MENIIQSNIVSLGKEKNPDEVQSVSGGQTNPKFEEQVHQWVEDVIDDNDSVTSYSRLSNFTGELYDKDNKNNLYNDDFPYREDRPEFPRRILSNNQQDNSIFMHIYSPYREDRNNKKLLDVDNIQEKFNRKPNKYYTTTDTEIKELLHIPQFYPVINTSRHPSTRTTNLASLYSSTDNVMQSSQMGGTNLNIEAFLNSPRRSSLISEENAILFANQELTGQMNQLNLNQPQHQRQQQTNYDENLFSRPKFPPVRHISGRLCASRITPECKKILMILSFFSIN